MIDSPRLNTPAKDFWLPSTEERRVTLREYLGKNVVLAFYPADWSPTCTTELTLIQETLEDIRGYHAEVVGVSCDGPHSHRAWAAAQGIRFPLLSDFWPHGAVSRDYGVFLEEQGTSTRALFFIDPAGVIRDCWIGEDPNIAPALNVIFKALERMRSSSGQPSRKARHGS